MPHTTTKKPNDLLAREDLMEVLRESGLRITVQRLQVLDLLQGMAPLQQELCAPRLWKELDQRDTRLPLAACYRTLSTFESAGVVSRRLDESSGRAVSVYLLQQKKRPPAIGKTQFRCVRCSRLTAFHDKTVLARLHALADAYDLELAPAASIEISAVCGHCAALGERAVQAGQADALPFPFSPAHGSPARGAAGPRA